MASISASADVLEAPWVALPDALLGDVPETQGVGVPVGLDRGGFLVHCGFLVKKDLDAGRLVNLRTLPCLARQNGRQINSAASANDTRDFCETYRGNHKSENSFRKDPGADRNPASGGRYTKRGLTDTPIASQPVPRLSVVIEDDCWLGAGVIVIDGIRIHRGIVIAAGAVIMKYTAPYSMVAGVPGRLVGTGFAQHNAGETSA